VLTNETTLQGDVRTVHKGEFLVQRSEASIHWNMSAEQRDMQRRHLGMR